MIKEALYKWKTKRALKKRYKIETICFDKAKNIGFLFDDEKNYAKCIHFINELQNQGKNVQVLIQSKKKTVSDENHYSTNDFKWFGKIDNQYIHNFILESYDYLFLLNEQPHYLTEYILASSKAKCKVGLHNEAKQSFFQLMFNNTKNESIDAFYKTIKMYLEKL